MIAVFSVAFTLIGLELGAAGRSRWKRPTELLAGLALIAVGVFVGIGWTG